jgi:3-hydroxyacyl-[acyl-carrier-protein] dehydratase
VSIKITDIDVVRIMEMIPHRYPFLMIDRMVEVIPDVSAVGIKNVSINEPFFQGHFSGHPVMPGVLIIEAMAQTSGVLVIQTMGAEAEGKLVYFMSVDQARFRKPVTPGDSLLITVTKLQNRGPVWKFKGEAHVGETLMAEATFAAMIVDNDK